jgi:hypothetical protein
MKQLNLLPIPRAENLTASAFRKSYLASNRPVVIKDMATSWPAMEKWTPQYFAREYGSLRVKIYDKSFIRAGSSYMSSLRKIDFSE